MAFGKEGVRRCAGRCARVPIRTVGANEAGAHDRKAARTPPNATERRLFGMIKPRRAAPTPDV